MLLRQISTYVSALSGERLERIENTLVDGVINEADINVDTSIKFQSIEGFGGAFNEAGWYCLLQLPEDVRIGVLKKLFDPVMGAGFTLCRTPIGSSDYSLQPYSYAEVPDDFELRHFSIEKDKEYLIPYIKAAKQINPNFKLLASPWSAPAWMKTNNDRENGGQLKPECYEVYAKYFVKYIQAYAQEGIEIHYVTVQNESEAVQTFDSMVWTPSQTAEFVGKYLGPAFEENSIDAKILIYDHNRDNWQYPVDVLNDDTANRYIYGTAVHGYACKEFENLSKIKNAHPDKAILFTEYSHPHAPNYSFRDGEVFGWSIINDINNWCSSWIYWNMVLNQDGGPNHDTWSQDALVVIDENRKDVAFEGEYYYISHFSKFVKPGAKRLNTVVNRNNVLATAFENYDGKIVLVAMNNSDKNINAAVNIDSQNSRLILPAHGIITAVME